MKKQNPDNFELWILNFEFLNPQFAIQNSKSIRSILQ